MDRVEVALKRAEECWQAAEEIRRGANLRQRDAVAVIAKELESAGNRWLAIASRALARQWSRLPRL